MELLGLYLVRGLLYLVMAFCGAVEIWFTINRFIEKNWLMFGLWFMSFIWTVSKFIQMSIM